MPGRNGSIALDLSTATGDDEFAFNCDTPNCVTDRLFSLDWRRRRVRALAVCRAAECHDSSPTWGPGGRSLAFMRGVYLPQTPAPAQPDRFFIAVASTGTVQLVTEPGHSPAWAPTGRRLAFVREKTERGVNGADIFALDLASGAVRRLTWRGGSAPAWSSTGRIAFARYRGNRFNVQVLDRDGKSRALTRDGRSAAPDWSPRARTIAFVHFHGARPDVDVMNADGSRRRVVARNAVSPDWSPDGRMIAFVRRSSIWVVRASGSRPRRLWTTRNSVGPFRLAWRPR